MADGVTKTATALAIPAEIDGKKVTAIGENVFTGCSNLESVTIPEGVKTIGKNTFSGCGILKQDEIALSVKFDLSVSPVSSIYDDPCMGVKMEKAPILFHSCLTGIRILIFHRKFEWKNAGGCDIWLFHHIFQWGCILSADAVAYLSC